MNASLARRIQFADLIIISALRPAHWAKRMTNHPKPASPPKPLRFPVSGTALHV